MSGDKGCILVIDDGKVQRDMLADILRRDGYTVLTAASGREGVEVLGQQRVHVVLTDLKMPDMDGIEVIRAVKAVDAAITVVVMTAYGTIESAVQSMKLGAYDYLSKPLQMEEVKVVLEKALENERLVTEVEQLRREVHRRYGFGNIVGSAPKMQELFNVMEKVAPGEATVMVYGESGTGKELVARALHYNSKRKGRGFVAIDCASFPESLLESELFGYEKGAFTGAVARRVGLFEEADGGTLFLDEIADLTPNTQAKLLRTLQQREIKRVGGVRPVSIDVRVIAATNRKLEQMMREGSFREDLYYRVNVIRLFIPPLRERRDDIPLLVNHFLKKYCGEGVQKKFSRDALDMALRYGWPGNVRQLESLVERAVLLSDGDTIGPNDFPVEVKEPAGSRAELAIEIPDEGISLAEVERTLMVKALRKADWSLNDAARLLGITYKTLLYRMQKFGIERETPV